MTGYQRCEAAVKALAAKYPAADLRFGYIGNVERWGDDRAWRVWADGIRVEGPWGRGPATFRGGSSSELDAFADKIEAGLEDWVKSFLVEVGASR